MGFAKYYEDNQRIRDERFYMGRSYTKWGDEAREYHNPETLRSHIEIQARQNKTTTIQICKTKLTSIDIRLELVNTSSPLRSAVMRETINHYAIELKKAKKMLEAELFKLDYNVSLKRNYGKNETKKYRSTFVYQLIENALLFISRIREDNMDEIRILSEDIRVLVMWENSSESKMLYTPCYYNELLAYFNARSFERSHLKCNYCGENYIYQTNYCLKCYNVRK